MMRGLQATVAEEVGAEPVVQTAPSERSWPDSGVGRMRNRSWICCREVLGKAS